MNNSRRPLLAIAFLLTGFLASCGGGGSDQVASDVAGEQTVKFAGMYEGTLEGNDSALRMLVLPDGQIWMTYGTKMDGVLNTTGFAKGRSNRTDNSITSLDMIDHGRLPGAPITLSATIDSGGGITGFIESLAINTGTAAAFSVASVTDQYDYNAPASHFDVTGSTYGTIAAGAVLVSAKTMWIVNGDCRARGTIEPDASGKNFFSAEVTFDATGCGTLGGVQLSGIMYWSTPRERIRRIAVFMTEVTTSPVRGGAFLRIEAERAQR